MTALRLEQIAAGYVTRLNPNHAPPGSPAGGQFTAASGGGASQSQGPAKNPQRKRELLATAKKDRAEARRLQARLAELVDQQRAAAKAARKAADAATPGGASGGKGGGKAVREATA